MIFEELATIIKSKKGDIIMSFNPFEQKPETALLPIFVDTNVMKYDTFCLNSSIL